ncbi:glycosyltransferase family 2 protein [Clostridium beijerinckii]|uniref:glycosyltransferase family 2 protein n=1 Tax=Clostridium beijerinckii TaxID=1520 RepID=UPI00098CCDEE|nr:glycosyltransferase family 2 protein [Clostridium beijerinckii]NRT79377.1 glycosyltransferase involved in cell wall biosynthesis [Clostridium beijerinckii]OOM49111.1 SPBc2 prophage-derived glycosyltransferase SunS [Clostridium beijerinckii]
MKLSIAMIVKNEERNLERTLKPLKELNRYIDTEIVIVDTGSEDKTVDIAKNYTDKIYFHKWNNDFAAMRNISIGYCTGDWILVLDADEYLYDAEVLGNLLNSNEINEYNSAYIQIANFNKDIENSVNNGFITTLIRMFKNNTVVYEGIVHEQPKHELPVLYTNIRVVHYGYDNNDYDLMEYKFKRNLELLFKQLENKNNPKSMVIYINFQISTTYAMHKDISEAMKYVKIAYDKAKNEIGKYIYVINRYCHLLYNMKNYEELLIKAKEALKHCDNFLDFYFYLGTACFNLNRYEEAIQAYKKYMFYHEELSKNNIPITNTLSILTREYKDTIIYNLAVCYFKEKCYEKALDTISKVNNKELLENKAHFIFRIIVEGKLWDKMYIIDELVNRYSYENILLYVQAELSIDELGVIIKNTKKGSLYKIVSLVKHYKENNNLNKKQVDGIKETIEEHKKLYSTYVYYLLKYDIEEIKFLCKYGKDVLENIIINLCSSYYDFNEILLKELKNHSSKIVDYNLKVVMLKALMLGGNLPNDKKKEIFLSFICEKYYSIIKAYNKETIVEKSWILSSEERFVIELKNALSYRYVDTIKYIRSLKEIIHIEKLYIDYVKIIIEDKLIEVNNSFKELLPELIRNINYIIEEKKYNEAYDTIEEALSLVKFDFSLMNLKYRLLILLNRENEARECAEELVLYGLSHEVMELINNI